MIAVSEIALVLKLNFHIYHFIINVHLQIKGTLLAVNCRVANSLLKWGICCCDKRKNIDKSGGKCYNIGV